jgi:hypothetical protein
MTSRRHPCTTRQPGRRSRGDYAVSRADLHAIEALNQQDMKAVLENDVATIISQAPTAAACGPAGANRSSATVEN